MRSSFQIPSGMCHEKSSQASSQGTGLSSYVSVAWGLSEFVLGCWGSCRCYICCNPNSSRTWLPQERFQGRGLPPCPSHRQDFLPHPQGVPESPAFRSSPKEHPSSPMVPSIPSALLVAGSIPSGGKTFTKKNYVNYQLDNLLIKGVVGSTIKTR